MKWIHYLYLAAACTAVSCNKDTFLDAKSNSSLVVPSTLQDMQALLDAYRMNETPSLGEVSADDYTINTNNAYMAMPTRDRNAYTWAKDIFAGQGNIPDWNIPYQNILYANVVLEGLGKIIPAAENQAAWSDIKGQALFIRAYQFYNLLQLFAPAYDSSTANTDLGIPIRLSADVSSSTGRATVQDAYRQVIADLTGARQYLPLTIAFNNRNRASVPAVFAMLARVYLAMNDYPAAFRYADSCLQRYSVLIDYNGITNTTNTPFTRLNEETIFQSKIYSDEVVITNLRFQTAGYAIDSLLYRSYDANDLRKQYYFIATSSGKYPRSGYSGEPSAFTGLAIDEIYLIHAEAAVRDGNINTALGDINKLLTKRYKTGTFTPYAGLTAAQLLDIVLQERRKELLLRGVRWTDIRRLNKLGMQLTPKRIVNANTYELPPNSPLYALPIPPDALALGEYPQNIR